MRAHLPSRTVLALVLLTAWAGSAAAQTGRLRGTIKDDRDQPIKSATVSAEFLDAAVSSITSTTDDKGRFAMIGLRVGDWAFRVQAPGYRAQVTAVHVRTVGV